MQSNSIFPHCNPYCSSVSAPRALRANKVTRKKRNFGMSKAKLMTGPGKTFQETRKTEKFLARKSQGKLRLATANVGSMVGRSAEVTETVGRRGVDIVALQEVRFRNEGVKRLRGGDFEYRLYWKGEETGYGGVGLMVRQELAECVMEVRRVSSRVLSLDLVLHGKVMTIISVYAPQCGRSEEEKEEFY